MSDISLKNGLISYYGNPAGYTEKEKAIVDTIFQNDELKNWLNKRNLTASWTDGVMEKLVAGEQIYGVEIPTPLKNVRIWQLKADVDVRMKFLDLDDILKDFGNPNIDNYISVYDGQLETNNLEEIYTRCNINHPHGYSGHSMSMSDLIELYDDNSNEYHYCDRFGFIQIDFEQGNELKHEQNQSQTRNKLQNQEQNQSSQVMLQSMTQSF